jgi:uncharacterized protein (TIGR03067 family)
MRRKWSVMTACAAVGLVAAGAWLYGQQKTGPVVGRDERILGTWTAVTLMRDGEIANLEKVSVTLRLTFSEAKVAIFFWRWECSFHYVCNPNANPHTLQVRNVNDEPINGIYKIDGDTLTVAYNEIANGKCPSTFDAKAGTRFVLLTLRRTK